MSDLSATERARKLARDLGTLDKPLFNRDAARALGVSQTTLNDLAASKLKLAPRREIGRGAAKAIWTPAALREAERVIQANEEAAKQGRFVKGSNKNPLC